MRDIYTVGALMPPMTAVITPSRMDKDTKDILETVNFIKDHMAKLEQLLEIEGFGTLEELLEAVLSDSISPGICTNDGCDYTTEVEPDQDRGWCEVCDTNTVKSAPILASLI